MSVNVALIARSEPRPGNVDPATSTRPRRPGNVDPIVTTPPGPRSLGASGRREPDSRGED